MRKINHRDLRGGLVLRGQADPNTKSLIVVPCYNEAVRLQPEAFLEFARQHKGIGFVFVDDGSKDETLAVLAQLRIQCAEKFHVISLKHNRGKAEAVRAGLAYASSQPVDYVGYWDADLATPLNAIVDFCTIFERLNDVDVVFGARKRLMGHRIRRQVRRRVVSGLCAVLARIAVAMPVSDTQCGAKLFRNSENLRSAIAAPFSSGWLFDVELFARMRLSTHQPQKTFYEFPLCEWHEVEGSKVQLGSILKSGFSILELIVRMRLFAGLFEEKTEKSAELPLKEATVWAPERRAEQGVA